MVGMEESEIWPRVKFVFFFNSAFAVLELKASMVNAPPAFTATSSPTSMVRVCSLSFEPCQPTPALTLEVLPSTAVMLPGALPLPLATPLCFPLRVTSLRVFTLTPFRATLPTLRDQASALRLPKVARPTLSPARVSAMLLPWPRE